LEPDFISISEPGFASDNPLFLFFLDLEEVLEPLDAPDSLEFSFALEPLDTPESLEFSFDLEPFDAPDSLELSRTLALSELPSGVSVFWLEDSFASLSSLVDFWEEDFLPSEEGISPPMVV